MNFQIQLKLKVFFFVMMFCFTQTAYTAEWIQLESLFAEKKEQKGNFFGSGGRGTINGYFSVAASEVSIKMKLPLRFIGKNRFTPQYYEKIVRPLLNYYSGKGGAEKQFLEFFPTKKEDFTPQNFEYYVASLITELKRVHSEIGINLEVEVMFEDVDLTENEIFLLGDYQLSEKDSPDFIEFIKNDMFKLNDQSYRSNSTISFLVYPIPNLIDLDRVPTEKYNPSIVQDRGIFIHEITHILWTLYEGYNDPYNSATGVMNDIGLIRHMQKGNVKSSYSVIEQLEIYKRIMHAVKGRGGQNEALRKKIARLETEVGRRSARFEVGLFDENSNSVNYFGEHKPVKLNAKQWEEFRQNVNPLYPILVEHNDRGDIISIQSALNYTMDWGRFLVGGGPFVAGGSGNLILRHRDLIRMDVGSCQEFLKHSRNPD